VVTRGWQQPKKRTFYIRDECKMGKKIRNRFTQTNTTPNKLGQWQQKAGKVSGAQMKQLKGHVAMAQ